MTTESALKLPKHLQRYVVSQRYERYTWQDQAVWRFCLKLLRDFLSVHAHEAYLPGLKSTGIGIESIPRIEDMDTRLQEFGWRAVPVSGFIPPAAFMELQSLGYLPIASDIRTADHLDYTPSPDIVHEAAGHAPILVDPQFSAYLQRYAQVARKSILHHKDLAQYEAIRNLSDLKENLHSTPKEIQTAEENLERINQDMEGTISEAALLSRMNWWTAEYGLIGDLKNPKIFGAGLLSSVGESRSCLKSGVKKIPLSVNCVEYGYDITEPQPQLFVAENFDQLNTVLDELAERLSFKIGGLHGLQTAVEAKTVNTVELDTGLQVSGVLDNFLLRPDRPTEVSYLQFSGGCQLSYGDKELEQHGRDYHSTGYGMALGRPKGSNHPLSAWDASDRSALGLEIGKRITLDFDSGIIVTGYLKDITFSESKQPLVLTFEDALVKSGTQVLFKPEWGPYDLGLGENVASVFGGPADRDAYGEVDSFVAQVIPFRKLDEAAQKRDRLYHELRQRREQPDSAPRDLREFFEEVAKEFSSDWILHLELYEQALRESHPLAPEVLNRVQSLAADRPHHKDFIDDGLLLIQKEF